MSDQNNEQYESFDEQYDDPNADPIVPEGWTIGGEVPAGMPEAPEQPQEAPEAQPEPPAQKVAETPAEPTPAPAEAQEETVLSQEDITKLKNKLRAEAEREVLERHRDEYHAVASAKFAEHGLEFTRRLTKAERDAERIKKMLADNPELADLIK